MPTMEQQKKADFSKWVITAEIQLKDFANLTQEDGQNKIRHAIQKLANTSKIFDDSFKWWKNTINANEVHSSEKLYKQVNSLHTKLELEYSRKD